MYRDKDGNQISGRERDDLMFDKSYRVIHEYCNNKIHLSAEWHGNCSKEAPVEYSEIFELKAYNISPTGKLIPDPSLSAKWNNIHEVRSEFDAAVCDNSESYMDDTTGNLVMIGNVLPSEDNLEDYGEDTDKPHSIGSELEGSW